MQWTWVLAVDEAGIVYTARQRLEMEGDERSTERLYCLFIPSGATLSDSTFAHARRPICLNVCVTACMIVHV